MEKSSNGPTLNESYNSVLRAWARDGHPAAPECEDCGLDLTGKDVEGMIRQGGGAGVFAEWTKWKAVLCRMEGR